MERFRPQLRPYKKPLARLKLPIITRARSKSLFEEYYYGFLIAFCVVVIVLLKAGGLGAYDSVIAGLWIGAIAFFVTQMIRYVKHKTNPQAEAKESAANSHPEKTTAANGAAQSKAKGSLPKPQPTVKDAGAIHLVPKAGQAPRPPIITGTARPSPFIKPPK